VTTYDVHQHLWPDGFVEALRARRSPPCLDDGLLRCEPGGEFPVDPAAYGVEARLAELDRDGIDAALVSCPPTLGIDLLPAEERDELVAAYHEGALAAAGPRLRPLAFGEARDGFAGACISALALFDHEALGSTLDELERREQVLFVHPGPTQAAILPWWDAVVDYAVQMQAAYLDWVARGVERWPRLRVVFAILAGGAPFQLERLRSRGVDPRTALRETVFLETASYGRRALELCLAVLGGRQILYGSDAPVIDPRPTLQAVRGFGGAVTDALCRDNPTALLG
jgi:hypothetical protein